MIVGIDQSLRSTAAVCLNSKGELVDFALINPPKDLTAESLIVYQLDYLYNFLQDLEGETGEGNIKGIALEGLSFNSVGSGKDMLAGIYWAIRVMLYDQFRETLVGTISVLEWRAAVLSKEERRALKEFKVKDGLKKAVVDKLPYEVRCKFEQYIVEKGVKKEAIYDLADAWGICKYRLSLE